MPLKTLPTIGDSNWGTPLNAHIGQLQSSSDGGINKFEQFSQRPTTLTADDVGKTYLYTQTGNIHQWTGTVWKVLNESVINVKDYGAIGDGIADDGIYINKSITEATASSTHKSVFIPAGKYLLTVSILISTKNVNIFGDSDSTVLFCNTPLAIFNLYFANNINISKLRLECSILSIGVLVSSSSDVNVSDCIFQLTKSCFGIYFDKSQNINVTKSTFFSLGTKSGVGIQNGPNSNQNIFIEQNKFRYLYDAIIINCDSKIINNFFDGGFYTAVSDFSGTANFTNTKLTDFTANFNGFDPAAVIVTVLSEKASGGFVNNGKIITDTTKNFISLGLLIGDLVYTTKCIGIIKKVLTNSLEVEEWLDKTNRLTIDSSGETSYKVYKTYIGRCITVAGGTGYTTSAVNVQGWWDMAGTSSIPPNGSQYEICKQKGNYQILCLQADYNVVISNNAMYRPYSDGIGMAASSFIIDSNYFYKTNDMGISIFPGGPGAITEPNYRAQGVVTNNLIEYAGSGGIYLGYASGVIVSSNRIMDATLAIEISVFFPATGIFIEEAKDCLVSNNLISKRISTKMANGIATYGSVSAITTVNNVILSPLV
jgi:Pectate lyase superfamily protein/Right handed beta helix region